MCQNGRDSRNDWPLFLLPRPTVLATSAGEVLHRPHAASRSTARRARRAARCLARAGVPMPAAGSIAQPVPSVLSGRRFVCACCQREVLVCSRCDRGQRYCGKGCSKQARRASTRAAGRRFQNSRAGRLAHARRARHYRQRRQQKIVTHQGCLAPRAGDVLGTDLIATTSTATAYAAAVPPPKSCHWCARSCGPLRWGWLRADPVCREPVARHQPTPHGQSP